MRKPYYTNRYKKDIHRIAKHTNKMYEIKQVLRKLIKGNELDKKYRDHPLKGKYKGMRECHITPDLLLIYMVEKNTITFIRTGTHSELFK